MPDTDTATSIPYRVTAAGRGHSAPHVSKVLQVTYRRLDYWARTDLVRPSIVDANGSGSRRQYSFDDIVDLALIDQLLGSGYKLEQVRVIMGDLPEDWTQGGEYLAIGRPIRSLYPTVRVTGELGLDIIIAEYVGPVTVLSIDHLVQNVDLALSVWAD